MTDGARAIRIHAAGRFQSFLELCFGSGMVLIPHFQHGLGDMLEIIHLRCLCAK